jgi:hypothetical protein
VKEKNMGRSVSVAYRPKPGKERELLAAVQKHLDVLSSEGLVTDRPPHVMRAADGTVLEVFAWSSADAIARAHSSPAVGSLWGEFGEPCDYVRLATLPEAQKMFAEFDSVSW